MIAGGFKVGVTGMPRRTVGRIRPGTTVVLFGVGHKVGRVDVQNAGQENEVFVLYDEEGTELARRTPNAKVEVRR